MSNAKEKRTLSLQSTILIAITTFIVIISAVLGTILTVQSVTSMKKMVSNKTIEMAVTAASLVDGDSVKGLKAEDEKTEAYQQFYNVLKAFRNSNEGTSGELAYIYGCRSIGNNKFEFTVDPSSNPAEFGEDLEWTKALNSANRGIPAFDDKPYTDRWGTFYSAYAPVFDSNGEVTMIVGIDVWAKWYNNAVWTNSRSIIIISSVGVVSGVLAGILISHRITKKFEVLSADYNELENDVRSLIKEIKEPIDDKNSRVDETNEKDQLTQLRTKIRITQKEIKDFIIYTRKQAYIDSLSRVGNRTAYAEKVKQIDLDSDFAIILYDINGLKFINDHFGHEQGDRAITSIAQVLKSVFDEGSIFRIGGDEFIVLLLDNDKDATLSLLDTVKEQFEKFNAEKKLAFPISVSQGVALYDRKKDKNYINAFKRADDEMYQRKEEFYKKNPEIKKYFIR